eukprot:1153850-Pelagomonas_calceolata.AAC.1
MAASCGDRDSIYCSALSDRGTLREALTDATNRALEGITGTSVDFALVFISSYPARECQHVVPTLRRLLPQVCSCMGCCWDDGRAGAIGWELALGWGVVRLTQMLLEKGLVNKGLAIFMSLANNS